jgi:hypothetical protein
VRGSGIREGGGMGNEDGTSRGGGRNER